MPSGGVRRPLLALSAALAAGCAAAGGCPSLAVAGGGVAAALLVAGCGLPLLAVAAHWRGAAAIATVGVGLAAGVALQADAMGSADAAARAIAHVPSGTLVRARVCVAQGVSPLRSDRAVASIDGLPGVRLPATVLPARLEALDAGRGWAPASGPIRVVLGGGIADLLPGDVRVCVARLIRPRPSGNPGAPADALPALPLLLVPHAAGLRPTQTVRARYALMRLAVGLRRRAVGWLATECRPADAALLAALLLGDRGGLTDAALAGFRRSGTVHVLAVSGLHVVLVLGALGWALAFAGLRRPWILGAVLTLAAAYALVAGLRVSVVRAALMTMLGAVGYLSARRADGWTALAAAAIVLCVVDPTAPLRPGWQLSFSAVGALLLGVPALGGGGGAAGPGLGTDRRRARVVGRLRAALAASTAATLGTAPLVWQHFGLLTPVAVLANVVAVPICGAVLIAGLAALPFLACGGGVGASAARGLGAGCSVLRVVAETAAALPGGWWALPRPGWPAALALLGAAAWMATGGGVRHPRWTATGLGVALAWALTPAPAGVPPLVTVLDVGQGSAVLLRTSGGHRILVDAGTASVPLGGARTIRDALHACGVGRLDLLVLTHGDADHVNAVAELADTLPVGAVWAGPAVPVRPEGRALLARLAGAGIPVRRAADGIRLTGLGPGTHLEFLHPGLGDGPPLLRGNQRSVVTRLVTPHGAVLVPGDIEEAGTTALCARHFADLRSEVLVAPHHGGRNDRLDLLLDAVRPRVVLLSVGRGFPTGATLRLLARRGIPAGITARHGAVAVWLEASGVRWCGWGAEPLPPLAP